MVYKAKTLEDIEAIVDRSRCVICGEVASGMSDRLYYLDTLRESKKLPVCSPYCNDILVDMDASKKHEIEAWN